MSAEERVFAEATARWMKTDCQDDVAVVSNFAALPCQIFAGGWVRPWERPRDGLGFGTWRGLAGPQEGQAQRSERACVRVCSHAALLSP